MQLVKKVLKEKVPLKEAIEQLGLELTTACFIIKKYQKNGTFPRRKLKRTKRIYNSSTSKVGLGKDAIENL